MRDLNKFGKVLFLNNCQIINLIVLLTSGTNYDQDRVIVVCLSLQTCLLACFRCALNFVFHLFGNMNMSILVSQS